MQALKLPALADGQIHLRSFFQSAEFLREEPAGYLAEVGLAITQWIGDAGQARLGRVQPEGLQAMAGWVAIPANQSR